jgi:hypothetical protein
MKRSDALYVQHKKKRVFAAQDESSAVPCSVSDSKSFVHRASLHFVVNVQKAQKPRVSVKSLLLQTSIMDSIQNQTSYWQQDKYDTDKRSMPDNFNSKQTKHNRNPPILI